MEAEEAPPAGPVLAGQEFGHSLPTAVQFPPQANAKEEGDGVEGDLAPGALHVELGEVVPQGGEVDEAQGDLQEGESGQDSWEGQVLWSQVAVLGAVVTFG